MTVDGRSVYLDFFGLVLWDLVPSPTSGEIKQIEIVRGPASVVWGANAVNGVVNIITKTPRENEGFGLVLGAGLFNRDEGSRESEGNGYQFNGSFSYANAINDTWSYRLNAGYFNSDPYSRPAGSVPLDCHPLAVDPCRTASGRRRRGRRPDRRRHVTRPTRISPAPSRTQGTSQPKFSLRFDQDFQNGGRVLYEGGYYGTQGIVHTGLGPFRLESGSYMAYGRVAYSKGALRISAFGNFLDAEAPNLMVVDPDTLGPIILAFKTQTYDFEIGNTNVLGGKHIITYGGNVRQNNFDISLAQGDDRTEYGAYGQWEFFVDKFRLAAGARMDKFGNLDDPVFSPRVSVMFKPTPNHSIRASYNRAFVSPSFINNYLDQNIQHPQPIDLTPLRPLLGPSGGAGAAALLPHGERLRQPRPEGAVDRRLRGRVHRDLRRQDDTRAGRLPVRHERQHQLHLHLTRRDCRDTRRRRYYSVTNPAKGVTVPTATTPAQAITLSPILMGILAQIPPQFGGPILLPEKAATYLNLGPIRNRGIEASIDHALQHGVDGLRQLLVAGHARRSWTRTPTRSRTPPRRWGSRPSTASTRAWATAARRFFGNVNVNYASEALWVDVLERFVRRLHRRLHDGERHAGREVRGRQGDGEPEGHQPHEREDPAAHLRRHPEAEHHGRGAVLHEVIPPGVRSTPGICCCRCWGRARPSFAPGPLFFSFRLSSPSARARTAVPRPEPLRSSPRFG